MSRFSCLFFTIQSPSRVPLDPVSRLPLTPFHFPLPHHLSSLLPFNSFLFTFLCCPASPSFLTLQPHHLTFLTGNLILTFTFSLFIVTPLMNLFFKLNRLFFIIYINFPVINLPFNSPSSPFLSQASHLFPTLTSPSPPTSLTPSPTPH